MTDFAKIGREGPEIKEFADIKCMSLTLLQPSIRDPSLNVHAGESFRLEVRWSPSDQGGDPQLGRRLVVSYNGEALFGWLPWGQQSNVTIATFDVGGKFESQLVGFLPTGEF